MIRLRTGTGRLTADMLNKTLRAGEIADRPPDGPVKYRSRWFGPIACRVTDSSLIQNFGNRWQYEVKEINFQNARLVTAPAGLFESDHVYNLAEFDNGPQTSSGISRSNLPGTFDVQRVPDGALVMVYVAETQETAADGAPCAAIFDRPGEFDGNCTALDGGDGGGGGSLAAKFTFEGTSAGTTGNTTQVNSQVFGGTDGGAANYYSQWGPLRQSTSANYFEFVFRVQGAYANADAWKTSLPNSQLGTTSISSGSTTLSTSASVIYYAPTTNSLVRIRWTPTTASDLANFWSLIQGGAPISISMDW